MARRTERPRDPRWMPINRFFIGTYLTVLIVVLAYLLVSLWPVPRIDPASAQPPCPPPLGGIPAATSTLTATATPSPTPVVTATPPAGATAPATPQAGQQTPVLACPASIFWGWVELSVTNEVRLILIALFAGALGSCIHATGSFADFVGNRRFEASWTWWYFLKPLLGAPLALLFYFLIRGGFLSAFATSSDVSPFGVAALAALVGLFSDRATLKLREVFDTLFKPADQRRDRLENGDEAPAITGFAPDAFTVGSADLVLTVRGRNFAPGTVVRIGGADRDTRVENATELRVTLLPDDVAAAGMLDVTVVTPERESEVQTLPVQ